MNKLGIAILATITVIVLIIGIIYKIQTLEPMIDDAKNKEEFNAKIKSYTNNIEKTLSNKNDPLLQNISGISTNFEGPKISIEFISHHGKIWDTEEEPYYIVNSSYIDFDPDWESYGLPNLRVEVEQPKFVSIVENGVLDKNIEKIKKLLPTISDITPIKSYLKTYKTSDGAYKKERFDLYLTEFSATVGIKPLRTDSVLPLRSEDKKKKVYPRYWYQDKLLAGKNALISLDDFDDYEEYKNQRYSRVHIAFKITPNNSAWYVQSKEGKQKEADVAIGAIIPKSITSNIINLSKDGKKNTTLPILTRDRQV